MDTVAPLLTVKTLNSVLPGRVGSRSTIRLLAPGPSMVILVALRFGRALSRLIVLELGRLKSIVFGTPGVTVLAWVIAQRRVPAGAVVECRVDRVGREKRAVLEPFQQQATPGVRASGRAGERDRDRAWVHAETGQNTLGDRVETCPCCIAWGVSFDSSVTEARLVCCGPASVLVLTPAGPKGCRRAPRAPRSSCDRKR